MCVFSLLLKDFIFCQVTKLLLGICQNHNYTDCLIKRPADTIVAMQVLFFQLHVLSSEENLFEPC